jgi:spore coat protein U-like protein
MNRLAWRGIKPLLLMALLALPGLAQADIACSVGADPLAFGSYVSPGGVQTDSSSVITVTCTLVNLLVCSTTYTVSLSTGGAGSYAPRKLASGSDRLDYNLYTSAAYSQVWGDGTGSTGTVSGTIVTGLLGLLLCNATRSNTHIVYGRIPAAQNVPAGAYSDTLTVTVTY